MRRNVYVKPGGLTATSARIGALVAALFLVFGATFGYVVLREMPSGESGEQIVTMMFFAIWIIACGAIVVFLLKIASTRGGAQANSLVELQFDEPGNDGVEDDVGPKRHG